MSLSAEEQLLLELTNRARLDPAGEADRLPRIDHDIPTPDTALQVLAYDPNLQQAASFHSTWILNTDTFSHTGAGGSSAGDRIVDAGYDFSSGGTWAENLALRGSTGELNVTSAVHIMHSNLFASDGHRVNMLNGQLREAGMAIEVGDYKGYDTAVATQNFGKAGNDRFLTGVAYTDNDGDAFYSVGEGMSGVRFSAAGQSAVTSESGGYNLSLGSEASRPWVTISTGTATYEVRILTREGNVKIDLVDEKTVATSASLALRGDTKNAELLGSGDLNLKGRAGSNELIGNIGDNLLVGRRGHDNLSGAAGNDILKGGGGRDTLEGGAGNDVLRTGRGTDHLEGGIGHDLLFGGGGRDWLQGDGGHDTLTGGRGADTFVFARNDGNDKITDFGRGDDVLLLEKALWQGDLNAREIVERYAHVKNGDVVFDFDDYGEIILDGVSNLTGLASSVDIF